MYHVRVATRTRGDGVTSGGGGEEALRKGVKSEVRETGRNVIHWTVNHQ